MTYSIAMSGTEVGVVADGADAGGDSSPVDRVHRLLIETLSIDCPTADSDIIESGALDSFALLELLVQIEEQFGVEVPMEDLDLDDFRTARVIARMVATLATRGPAQE